MKLYNDCSLELTIMMPCLNEEGSVGESVKEALEFINEHNIKGEVLVIDNASTDGSVDEARQAGAVVETETRRGYGSALIKGIELSRGSVIIFGDCDTTYDFKDLTGFYEPLRDKKFDVMIGDRLRGNAEKGAMQMSHILGVKALSAFGRARYGTDVRDFHCGLRGLTREAALKMELKSTGMEFATEFIAEACRKKLSIGQTGIRLRLSKGGRRSKLNPIRDGLRHLGLMIGTQE